MKAAISAMGGRVRFEAEASTPKEMWKKLALVQSIFDADAACGVCGNKEIRFSHRSPKGFEYFELECGDPKCGARLGFGQHKVGGTLFAKRKDESGNWLDYDGWAKYNPESHAQPEADHGKAGAGMTDDDVPF